MLSTNDFFEQVENDALHRLARGYASPSNLARSGVASKRRRSLLLKLFLKGEIHVRHGSHPRPIEESRRQNGLVADRWCLPLFLFSNPPEPQTLKRRQSPARPLATGEVPTNARPSPPSGGE